MADVNHDTYDHTGIPGVGITQATHDASDHTGVPGVDGGGGGGGGLSFAGTTTDAGLTQNANTSSSVAFMEQAIRVYRPLKLDAILWDIRIASDYTMTVRDLGDNVLHTVAVNGVSAASLNTVFGLSPDPILQPGHYKVRMTAAASVLWYSFNSSADQLFDAYAIINSLNYGGASATVRAPLKLRYCDGSFSG